MDDTIHGAARPVRLRSHGWLLAGLWTAAFTAALTWEFVDTRNQAQEIARGVARGAAHRKKLIHTSAGYGGVWLLGLCGIALTSRHLRRQIARREEAEARLQRAHDTLERRVAERTNELEQANQELQREVADHKQAEWWLLQSEERFRSYFELGLVGMAIISPQGDWEEVNHRLCDSLGYSEVELTGKKWCELIHPDDEQADRIRFDRILAGVNNGYAVDRRFLRKDGQVVHAHLSVRCLRRPDGTVDCLIALVQDITHHKRTEEELRASSAQYETLLAAVPDVLVEVDASRTITWANKAGFDFFGDDALGKKVTCDCEEEHRTCEVARPLSGNDSDVFYLENWLQRKDGQKRLLAWWCRTLRDAEGNVTGTLSSGRDVTDYVAQLQLVAEMTPEGDHPPQQGQEFSWIDLSAQSTSAFCFADFTAVSNRTSPSSPAD